MTQENKELLKDLCARLPYGVKVKFYDHWVDEYEIIPLTAKLLADTVYIGDIRPYLFPMSSMSAEQYVEFVNLGKATSDDCFDGVNFNQLDWLIAHHFDYRGLIEKGLAIDATGLGIYENR